MKSRGDGAALALIFCHGLIWTVRLPSKLVSLGSRVAHGAEPAIKAVSANFPVFVVGC